MILGCGTQYENGMTVYHLDFKIFSDSSPKITEYKNTSQGVWRDTIKINVGNLVVKSDECFVSRKSAITDCLRQISEMRTWLRKFFRTYEELLKC